MRSAPTASFNDLKVSNNANYDLTVSSIRGANYGVDSCLIGFNTATSGTTFAAVSLSSSSATGYLDLSAEL